jgi:hypothetical protein
MWADGGWTWHALHGSTSDLLGLHGACTRLCMRILLLLLLSMRCSISSESLFGSLF